MLEFGGTIKARFIVNHKLAIKPGFNIGYRQTFSESEDARCKGLGLNGSCEIQYRTPMDLIVYGDIGFLTQPVGGVQDVAYMLFSPIFYIALGIGL
ncbi:hypothetical protein KA005_46980 [bacterium]|nr:hypothetical protein [bacterium]